MYLYIHMGVTYLLMGLISIRAFGKTQQARRAHEREGGFEVGGGGSLANTVPRASKSPPFKEYTLNHK